MKQTKPLRVALVGLGRQGYKHLMCLRALADQGAVEIVGYCDISVSVSLPNVPFFTDYLQLLEQTKPQVVVLAVPNHMHAIIASDAVSSGCDVIKEKPLAVDLPTGTRLIEKANHFHKLILTTQHRYYVDLVQKTKAHLSEIGSVSQFSYTFCVDDQTQSWYWDINRAGGGSWLNLGWHGVALIQWLFGPVSSIKLSWNRGGKRSWHYQTDHSALAQVTLSNGAKGSIFVSCVQPKNERLWIKGTTGSLQLTRQTLKLASPAQTIEYRAQQTQDQAYKLMYKDILQHLTQRDYDMKSDLDILKTIQAGIDSTMNSIS